MALFRDVYPVAHITEGADLNQIVEDLLQTLLRKGYICKGDRVIITMGDKVGNQGGTNTLRLIQMGDDDEGESQSRSYNFV